MCFKGMINVCICCEKNYSQSAIQRAEIARLHFQKEYDAAKTFPHFQKNIVTLPAVF